MSCYVLSVSAWSYIRKADVAFYCEDTRQQGSNKQCEEGTLMVFCVPKQNKMSDLVHDTVQDLGINNTVGKLRVLSWNDMTAENGMAASAGHGGACGNPITQEGEASRSLFLSPAWSTLYIPGWQDSVLVNQTYP